MPKHWLASKTAPNPPVLDWLKWSGQDLERHIAESGTIGTIIGINKMGDIQTIYNTIVIPNAFASGNSAIIGNSSDVHTAYRAGFHLYGCRRYWFIFDRGNFY
jgi:hypothetical protein